MIIMSTHLDSKVLLSGGQASIAAFAISLRENSLSFKAVKQKLKTDQLSPMYCGG